MRGEETPEDPSGPSESGISSSRLDDLELERVRLTEFRNFEAALGTMAQISHLNVGGKEQKIPWASTLSRPRAEALRGAMMTGMTGMTSEISLNQREA